MEDAILSFNSKNELNKLREKIMSCNKILSLSFINLDLNEVLASSIKNILIRTKVKYLYIDNTFVSHPFLPDSCFLDIVSQCEVEYLTIRNCLDDSILDEYSIRSLFDVIATSCSLRHLDITDSNISREYLFQLIKITSERNISLTPNIKFPIFNHVNNQNLSLYSSSKYERLDKVNNSGDMLITKKNITNFGHNSYNLH